MARKNSSENASKTVTSRSTKNKPSILDFFPKKQKSTVSIVDAPEEKTSDPVQEQILPGALKEDRVESQSTSDYELDETSVNVVEEQPVSEQTTSTASALLLPPEETRFSPEIQIVEPLSRATGLQKDDPILVDSSPIKPSKKPAPSKPVYSIFAPRTHRDPSITPVIPTKSRVSHREAPFPDHSSQHVRGPQTSYAASMTSLPPRRHTPILSSSSVPLSQIIGSSAEEENTGTSTDVSRVQASTSYSTRATHLASIPTEHLQSHSVIAHLTKIATTERASSHHSHKLWTDKWHPSRADHVLGNEDQAVYLRQWLCALKINLTPSSPPRQSQVSGRSEKGKGKSQKRGTKRRNVIRTVDKRLARKRQRIDSDDDDDSWIVYSDDILEDEYQSPEDFVDAGKPLENTRPRLYRGSSSESNHIFDRLTNTILLCGPHSSGKTSAVYACAEELGWEVFEIYPGMGKRSGANLDNLVGEVGKNHLVRKTRLRNREPGTSTGLDDHPEHLTSMAEFELELVDSDQVDGEAPGATPRQSLILLEEVDILFKDDVNFWGSVINLIKDSKRPVILTCNDVSLVPVADIPLQDILNFDLCSTPVATSFLQALCCAEGYLLERDVLSRFYERPGSLEVDLRRAIHNLQLWCSENLRVAYQEDEDVLYWEFQSSDASALQAREISVTDAYHAELVSFVDCYLLWKAEDTAKEMVLNDVDDVLGHRILSNGLSFQRNQLGYQNQDELIVSTAIELSRGAHRTAGSDRSRFNNTNNTTRASLQNRVRYDETVNEFGSNVVAGRSQIIRRPVFDCDYLPWIRQMVAAEDKQEEAMLKRNEEEIGRRTTRNSQRFARTIELSVNTRVGLDATAFENFT